MMLLEGSAQSLAHDAEKPTWSVRRLPARSLANCNSAAGPALMTLRSRFSSDSRNTFSAHLRSVMSRRDFGSCRRGFLYNPLWLSISVSERGIVLPSLRSRSVSKSFHAFAALNATQDVRFLLARVPRISQARNRLPDHLRGRTNKTDTPLPRPACNDAGCVSSP